MDQQLDFAGDLVKVGDHLLHHCPDDALPEARIGGRRPPDGLQVLGQADKV
jgi:hypothetical protein